MLALRRRVFAALSGIAVFFLYYSWINPSVWPGAFEGTRLGAGFAPGGPKLDPKVLNDESYFWRQVPTHYPVLPAQSMTPLPRGRPSALPRVQAAFSRESARERSIRLQRQLAVKSAFRRCWETYQQHAWMEDEVTPVTGKSRNTFGGWGATLVDSLDTLWIMGLHKEFEQAVNAAVNVDFTNSTLETVNTFETTIRYLGGFLSAYDLSGDHRLLRKAREVGDMLYVAFDTPNRMPISRWNFSSAAAGNKQEAPEFSLVAEIGSMCMEFTRLSLLTGNPKWLDATERITETLKAQQGSTKLPGLWPIGTNPREMKFNQDGTFSLGAMADSVFEYLPKMVALTGGLLPSYQQMYEDAMTTALSNNLFRPMLPDEADVLISGIVHVEEKDGETSAMLEPQGQHLVCFAGGMLALGSKLFSLPDHLDKARKVTDGCIWTYKNMPLGIMPEVFTMTPCKTDSKKCRWDEKRWKEDVLRRAQDDSGDLSRADGIIAEKRLPKGFAKIADGRYILRPEAIESVFLLYRITGDKDLFDAAWAMWQAVQTATETELANSALADVTRAADPGKTDQMESFWMGETLKYFYLVFSEPGLVSLDEFVFNTEAHPLKRLLP